jgi:two-component system, NtrC family, sensor histidine kinase PilS
VTDVPGAPARRRADRRRVDRRTGAKGTQDDSLFGALGVGVDTLGMADSRASTLDSGFAGGLGAGVQPPASTRAVRREVRRLLRSPDSAITRIYATYAAARMALGLALLVAQLATAWLGMRSTFELVVVCVAYAAQAVALWLLPRLRGEPEAGASGQELAVLHRRQWMLTIGVDVFAFMLMHALDPGASFNFVALLVLPVLMAGVLSSRVAALATAAAVALMLLLVAWRTTLSGQESAVLMMQTGMAGLGFFAITLLAGELAGRLAREELAARGSMELARQQAQLNRLVIEEMADGVLVVDQHLRVRAANPAARTLLQSAGMAPPAPFQLQNQAAWAPLARAVEEAFASRQWPEAGRELTLPFEDGRHSTVRTRVRFTLGRGLHDAVEGDDSAQGLCVLLLEDVRIAQARVLQEKLAAMGRVSVGIAHEIRNPLSAIAQANALMLEDELPSAQARLARIVEDNVKRLKNIVDDVMELAPGSPGVSPRLDAREAVSAGVVDWAATAGVEIGLKRRLRLELPVHELPIYFDPEHLRRVLVNLLDNAQRHSSSGQAAMVVRLAARDAESAVLLVDSDSEPIPPDVERFLFEPFFSTRSRGTGLGLYICRELCQRYGAEIEYRQRPSTELNRNVFQVTMRRAPAAPAAA